MLQTGLVKWTCVSTWAQAATATQYRFHYAANTLSESVVMLMEGFLAVTAVLEPHLLLRPAAAPHSCSPSALLVPGDDLLPGKIRKNEQIQESSSPQEHYIFSTKVHAITNPVTQQCVLVAYFFKYRLEWAYNTHHARLVFLNFRLMKTQKIKF